MVSGCVGEISNEDGRVKRWKVKGEEECTDFY